MDENYNKSERILIPKRRTKNQHTSRLTFRESIKTQDPLRLEPSTLEETPVDFDPLKESKSDQQLSMSTLIQVEGGKNPEEEATLPNLADLPLTQGDGGKEALRRRLYILYAKGDKSNPIIQSTINILVGVIYRIKDLEKKKGSNTELNTMLTQYNSLVKTLEIIGGRKTQSQGFWVSPYSKMTDAQLQKVEAEFDAILGKRNRNFPSPVVPENEEEK
jgi:hypothetical protein